MQDQNHHIRPSVKVYVKIRGKFIIQILKFITYGPV